MKDKTRILLLAGVFVLFWLKSAIFLDPDFGWHLRLGNLILREGIPKTDPFSYSMPSFPYIDHEWLTDVALAWLYPRIGYIGLAAIFALLTALSLVIVFPSLKLKEEKALFILSVSTIFAFTGIRPQVLSWLFLATIFRFQKYLYFFPLLFLLWANLHGSFALGLGALALFWMIKALRKKQLLSKELLIWALCLGAVLVNPYGPRLWREVWSSFSDTSLRWRIAEWMPSIFSLIWPFWTLVPLSVLFLFRYRTLFKLEELVLALFFLFQAFSSQRHIPLGIIYLLPLVFQSLSFFKEELLSVTAGKERFEKVMDFAFRGSIIISLLFFSICGYDFLSLREISFYPQQAIRFLKENPVKGEIFSNYGWGGCLIWKMPEKKVFIDGRMPSWKQAPIKGESSDAMRDYLSLQEKPAALELLNKYQVKTVLWPVSRPCRFRFCQKPYDFLSELKSSGWQEIYRDPVAVIYRR